MNWDALGITSVLAAAFVAFIFFVSGCERTKWMRDSDLRSERSTQEMLLRTECIKGGGTVIAAEPGHHCIRTKP